MKKFVRLCDGISMAFGSIAGIMMLLSVAMVFIEIILRTLFSKTLYITDEYSGYLMVGITFLGLSYTLKEKGHIRMVFLHKLLKGKAKIILDIYTFAIGLLFFVAVTYTTTCFFWDSVVSQSRSMQISSTYLAIPQFLMPLGSMAIALQFCAELVRSINELRSGVVHSQGVESKTLGH